MYIVPIAWLYVAVMMAAAEATSSNGTILGALVTFVLYGVFPVTIVLYFMGTPARRRAIRARESAERQAAMQAAAQVEASTPPDTGSHPPADAVTPVGKET